MPEWKRYKLKRVLKRNVRKVVYLAWDAVQKRRVIVKQSSSRARAKRERDVAALCANQPHLVRVYDGFVRNGRSYLVIEWVRGRSLKKLIRCLHLFRVEKVVQIAMNILKGVDALHRRGFIHADLHADNVIVTSLRSADLKIIDFELAVPMDDEGKARANRLLPQPPAHLPPESSQRIIGPSYDLYGVGFMCACMMMGSNLTSRPEITPALLEKNPIWEVIRKATDLDPAERYRSAREMMEALNALDRPGPRVRHFPAELPWRVNRPTLRTP